MLVCLLLPLKAVTSRSMQTSVHEKKMYVLDRLESGLTLRSAILLGTSRRKALVAAAAGAGAGEGEERNGRGT